MLSPEHLAKLATIETAVGKLDRQLTEEQLDFIFHPIDQGCYLKACPGSGKTEVVGIKTVYEILRWNSRFSGIATLSFTKNAAKEIGERVRRYGSVHALSHPHFVGTIDSWLHSFILHPFAHHSVKFKSNTQDFSFRLVDNESHYDFLNSFKTVLSTKPKYRDAQVNDYYFECGEPLMIRSQKKTLKLDNVNEKVMKELQANKKKFFKAGLTTYADAEFLCYTLLKSHLDILKNVVARFPVLLIDECQDLSHNQLEIFKLLCSQGAVVYLIGDPNQSIYEFKRVYIEKIFDFVNHQNLKTLSLTRNFRSNQDIVNLCLKLEDIHAKHPGTPVVGHELKLMTDVCLLWEYTGEDIHFLPQKFINYIGELNVILSSQDKSISIDKSAIIARGHTTLSQFRSQKLNELSKVQLLANAIACWNQQPRTTQDLQNSLQQAGKSLCMLFYDGAGNPSRQFTPSKYTSVEWRNKLTKILDLASKPSLELFPFGEKTWSVWAKSLKEFLSHIYLDFPEPSKTWDKIKTTVIAPGGLADKPVSEALKLVEAKYSHDLRLTTFHDVKGETLDATLIISSKDKSSKGGHYEHWICKDPNNEEFIRFAYVACSRPKHLLVWAIPKVKNNKYIKTLELMGFITTKT
jgi:DNA helicase-2/ATP-dependent DNA helicase PcrA